MLYKPAAGVGLTLPSEVFLGSPMRVSEPPTEDKLRFQLVTGSSGMVFWRLRRHYPSHKCSSDGNLMSEPAASDLPGTSHETINSNFPSNQGRLSIVP